MRTINEFMRKAIYMMMAIMVMGALSACGDDDDDDDDNGGGGGGNSSALNGKWVLTGDYYWESDENSYSHTYENGGSYLYISGASIRWTETYSGQETTRDEGTFTLSGRNMTINVTESDGDNDIWHFVYTLSEDNNKLTLRDNYEDGSYDEEYYSRVQ